MDRAAVVTLARGIERFLLPNACVSCDRSQGAASSALVCTVCVARLRYLSRGCTRCRQPEPLIGPCRFCDPWPPALRTVNSAVWLTDESRAMIHHLKYEGYRRVAHDLARVMARAVRPQTVGLVVPIPLGPRRERERGYNQAAAIGRCLADRWEMPLDERLLKRVVETRSQTKLAPEERVRNVTNVFGAQRPAGADEPPVILIDDVLTTGATLASAASSLERAGWTEIHAVTFARAMPFEVSVGHDDLPRTVRS